MACVCISFFVSMIHILSTHFPKIIKHSLYKPSALPEVSVSARLAGPASPKDSPVSILPCTEITRLWPQVWLYLTWILRAELTFLFVQQAFYWTICLPKLKRCVSLRKSILKLHICGFKCFWYLPYYYQSRPWSRSTKTNRKYMCSET